MQIRRLVIERFRGLRHVELYPGRRTIIIGPNNSGKSTILEALDILLNSHQGRTQPSLTETDYFERKPEAGFRIEAVLGDLSEEMLAAGYHHLEGWKAREKEVVAEPSGPDTDPVVRVRAIGTPDLELVHEFSKPESEGARFGRSSRGLVSWLYDGRKRDPNYQLAFYQGGILDRLFKGSELGPALTALKGGIKTGATAINEDPTISKVLEGLGKDLVDVGLLAVPKRPDFEPRDITQRQLLQNLRLVLARDENVNVPISCHGRGAQRLLLVSVLLRLAKSAGQATIAAFEEPEEALEPVRQAHISEMLAELATKERGGQLFIVTHSTQIATFFELDDFVLMPETGSGQPPQHLCEQLNSHARQAYERRLDGPILRGVFAKIPVLVEGPGDRAVFEVFWRHLTKVNRVPHFANIGLDVINTEGVTLMPMMANVLKCAGRKVVAWVDQDTDEAMKEVKRLREEGNCAAIVLHNPATTRNSLEGALVAECSIKAVWSALDDIAKDRSYDYDTQRDDLMSRLGDIEQATREQLKAANSLESFFNILPVERARELAVAALSAKGKKGRTPPFEMKGARPARLVASRIVEVDGAVPASFAKAFEELGKWIRAGSDSTAEIVMP